MGCDAEYSISNGNHHFQLKLLGNVAGRKIYKLVSFYNCAIATISFHRTLQCLPSG